jgi:cysteine desulfuration protein SufE
MTSSAVGAKVPARLTEFLADLAALGDRSERIEALIGIAKRYRPVAPEIAMPPYDDLHKVPACESQAYVWALPQGDGTLRFHFAVLNPQGISAMAMAVILDENLSGAPVAEVAAVPSDIVYTIFGRELSMGKSMGLMAMVTMVRAAAERAAATRA